MKRNAPLAVFADTKPHYPLLDGLRGVAALLVVWYHVFEGFAFAGEKPIIEGINHGYLAVDFFFILSGFVVGYAYDDRWERTLSLSGFVKRRVIRLHPMVVMGALIGLICFAFQNFTRWDGAQSPLWSVLLAFLLSALLLPVVPGSAPEVRGNGEMYPLNGPCWSLFFEYIGNLLYALILRRLRTAYLAFVVLMGGFALLWFTVSDASGYGSLGVGWTLDGMNFVGGFLRMFVPFGMGLLLSRVFRPIRIKGSFWWCTAVLLVLFHVPYIAGLSKSFCLNGIFESVCILLVFPLLVWMGASGVTTDRKSTAICRFLGDISFPLYIVHYPLMYLFYSWLIKTSKFTFAETWPVAIVVYVGSVVLAWLCLKFYDIPVRRKLVSRFLRKSENKN